MQPALCYPAHTVAEPKQITFELLMRGAENQAQTCTHSLMHVPNTGGGDTSEISRSPVKYLWTLPPSLGANAKVVV